MEPPQPCLEEEEFLAPKSVWAELKAKLVPVEVPEVVSILGHAQIDRNDELHAEMATLLDILREYKAAVDGKAQQWRARFARDTNRDMLTTEIRSFISALRSKTSTPISLRPSTPHDRSVLGYVLPEQEAEVLLGTQSARQLVSSRGGGGVPANVGELQRPGTAEVAGRLAREIAASDGGREGAGRLSLESMEREAQRFQEVLKQEEDELKEHIEFLHQVLEAEHERDGLHSAVPTTNDLKDLRDKLQTELSFATAEDRISKSKALGGSSRLTPLAPLGQRADGSMSLTNTLAGSLPRAATPLCPAPLPSLPPSRAGRDEEGAGHGGALGSVQLPRDSPAHPPPASAGSASSGCRSAGDSVYQDPASSRPLSRMAAEIGLDLDSDEDDFLFGGDDDEMHAARLRSKAAASRAAPDVLVLDDDDDGAPPAHPAQRPKKESRGIRSKSSGELAGRGAVATGTGGGVEGAGGCEVEVVDVELEEQSKALRCLLSGLVVRDTLTSQHGFAEGDDAVIGSNSAAAETQGAAAVLDIGAAAGAGAGAARRVSLGRHRTLIQQARGAQQDHEHSPADDCASPGSPTSTNSLSAPSAAAAAANRPGPLRAKGQDSAELAIGGAPMALGPRGPSRGLAGGSRTKPTLPPPAAPQGGSRGRPTIGGLVPLGSIPGNNPPTPPTAPRRPPGSASERLRPVYARPSAASTPPVAPRS